MSETHSAYDAQTNQTQTDMLNGMMQPLQRRIAALEAERDALTAQVAALPRAAVLAFACLMEAKMAARDDRPDITSYTPAEAMELLRDERKELEIANACGDTDGIIAEAVDEAVCCLIRVVAERTDALGEFDGRGRTQKRSHA